MKLKIKADRWPWQKNGAKKWGWRKVPCYGRFGGGWHWVLGFEASGSELILNLLYGQIKITVTK